MSLSRRYWSCSHLTLWKWNEGRYQSTWELYLFDPFRQCIFFICERTKAVKSTVSRLKVYVLRYLQNHLLHIKSELLSEYLRCMCQVSSQFTQNFIKRESILSKNLSLASRRKYHSNITLHFIYIYIYI